MAVAGHSAETWSEGHVDGVVAVAMLCHVAVTMLCTVSRGVGVVIS